MLWVQGTGYAWVERLICYKLRRQGEWPGASTARGAPKTSKSKPDDLRKNIELEHPYFFGCGLIVAEKSKSPPATKISGRGANVKKQGRVPAGQETRAIDTLLPTWILCRVALTRLRVLRFVHGRVFVQHPQQQLCGRRRRNGVSKYDVFRAHVFSVQGFIGVIVRTQG